MINQDIYKVVICGNSQTGKTSIMQRYCTGRFDQFSNPTVGADFISQTVYDGDKEFKLHIWDTAGQEQYQAIGLLYFRAAALAIVVYDVTMPNPMDEIMKWITRMKEAEKTAAIVVLGNKIDLNPIPPTVVEEWCTQNDHQHFFVSARSGANIQEAFDYVIHTLSKKKSTHQNPTIVIEPSKQKKSCC